MMLRFLTLLLVFFSSSFAQTGILSGVVRDSETREPVIGATVRLVGTSFGTSTSLDGRMILTGVLMGNHTLRISHVAYQTVKLDIAVAANETTQVEILLSAVEIEESEVVVTGTRTMHSIADVPVRIEAIPQEEIEEKALMTPSSVAMLLNEATGARVQTTSSTSGALNLRIQGLSGRYTQILIDGIPSFGGLAGGFGLTQLVPLNLRQVEIVKGAGSALYGADAIAGTVNFITREPREEFEATAVLNGTTQKGFDAGAFVGEKSRDFGYTIFASTNTQQRYDVDGDNFSDVPGYDRFAVAPKIIYRVNKDLRVTANLGYLSEERIGGVANASRVPSGSAAPYLEQITSTRWDISAQVHWTTNETSSFQVKIANMHLVRDALFGKAPFYAIQDVLYGEAQFVAELGSHTILAGAVISSDELNDRTPGSRTPTSYSFNVPGLLLQDEIRFSEQYTLLLSGRADFHNRFGTFLTPRGSFMYRATSELTLRLGVGGGFKAPTVFVEESEELGYSNVRTMSGVRAEDARSTSFDVNWRTTIGPVVVTANCALYATWIDDALLADDDSLIQQAIFLRNATGPTFTRGGETLVKLVYDNFKLTLGYTYTYATQEDGGRTEELDLNPRHSFGGVAVWENREAGWKVGWETYWTGKQQLKRNPFRSQSPSYWNTGMIVEKSFGQIRIFINFENIFDTRQTHFERIVNGSPEAGLFNRLPIYTPLEGRVVNGGIRIVL
jgi:iron complex outermembrane receptor protein